MYSVQSQLPVFGIVDKLEKAYPGVDCLFIYLLCLRVTPCIYVEKIVLDILIFGAYLIYGTGRVKMPNLRDETGPSRKI